MLALALAATFLAAPPQGDRVPGTGRVVYATAQRAYLDVGAEDGLAAGAELALSRGAARVGTCRVEELAPHHATCAGAPARPGDAFRFEAATAALAPRPLPPPLGSEEVARIAAAVAAAKIPLVEFRRGAASEGRRSERAAPRVDAAIVHTSWAATTAGAQHAERADLLLRSAELLPGWALDLDARAERWARGEATRFRTGEAARFYLWQAQLSGDPLGRNVALAAGRILPWSIPGAAPFDGAQVALRGGAIEGGVFGGGIPEPDTLAPTIDRATAGAFWRADARAGGGLLRHEARLAWVRTPELGDRAELTARGAAWLGRALDLAAEAQLGAGGDVRAPGSLDAARVDLGSRPIAPLSVGVRWEYLALEVPQRLEPAAFPGRSRRADAFASLDLGRAMRLGATAGFARDLGSDLDRRWAGPELTLPRLLGGRASVGLGWLEERGWLDGRTAWLQVGARPRRSLRLLGRVSWTRDQDLGSDRDEIGFLGSASADLGRRFGLRLSVHGRAGGDLDGAEGASTPAGLTAHAALAARY